MEEKMLNDVNVDSKRLTNNCKAFDSKLKNIFPEHYKELNYKSNLRIFSSAAIFCYYIIQKYCLIPSFK